MNVFPRLPVLAWYWNRLRCMSAGEVGHRIYQKVMSRVQKIGLGVAKNVPLADLTRISRNFVGRDTRVAHDPYMRAAASVLVGDLRVFRHNCQFDLTPDWNQDPKTGTHAPLAFGKSLNYRSESVVGDIKYLWEPNRHLQLATLAQAYHQSREQRFLDGLQHQLESWFDQCPYMRGPNWTSSLELAIRLINWSIAWQLIGGAGSPVFTGSKGLIFRERWLQSVYQHMHFIRGHFSRYSSANNHLIGELSGLYVGCATWPYWPEIAKWRQTAKVGLEREALQQNTDDGVNREQAISYQQFVLDFLLLAGLAGRENGDAFSQPFWQRIESMLEFIASVMDVNGSVPMIGDADDGYAVRLSQEETFCPYRSLLATGAILFKRGDFAAKAGQLDDKTRWLIGNASDKSYTSIPVNTAALPVRREFREGGYYVLGCEFETPKEIRVIADAGPLGYLSIAAHGHADALAFTLSVGGREILIDPGTYAYHTQKKWRNYFRGTAAHNTVTVDGENQSEIGGNFLWLRKANVTCEQWEPGSEFDHIIGSHDGYRRLGDPVIHRREIILDKAGRRIVITDTLECTGQHRAECHWHFSESCEVWREGVRLHAGNGKMEVSFRLADPALQFELHSGEENPPCGWVSRSFDVKIPATTAVVPFAVHGRTTLITEIVCGDGLAINSNSAGEEK